MPPAGLLVEHPCCVSFVPQRATRPFSSALHHHSFIASLFASPWGTHTQTECLSFLFFFSEGGGLFDTEKGSIAGGEPLKRPPQKKADGLMLLKPGDFNLIRCTCLWALV